MAVRVSRHAFQQADLRLRAQYLHAFASGFGGSLAAWVKQLAEEALHKGRRTARGHMVWRRIIFAFDERQDPVVLVTVIVPDHRRTKRYGRSRVVSLGRQAEERLERSAALARGDSELFE